MRRYQRLSIEEREEISRLIPMGISIRGMGRFLDRSPSTISRELCRFSRNYQYRAIGATRQAYRYASSRRLGKRKLVLVDSLRKVVLQRLRLYWSPDQIATWLKNQYDNPKMHVSKESIYTYIYVLGRGELRKELTQCLRRAHRKRRTRGRSFKGQTSNLPEMISIEERPKEVEDRTVPGHWEGDLLIGDMKKQTAIGTLVERTTRALILVPLKNKTAEEVRKAFTREMKTLPKQMRLTLTYDQGREMAQHQLFTKETKIKVYFAHPKSPWERGSNENTNGLLRQFFPKNTNFYNVPRKELKRVQLLMNQRPRKTLNWKTPQEAMYELLH